MTQIGRTRRWDRIDLILMGVLLLLAAAVRVPHLRETVWGDEALYYYLAKTFGHDRGWVDFPDNTASQIAYRPLLFVLYFPIAQLGLFVTRACNCLVGCGVVAAVYGISRRFGAPRVAALLAAVLVVAHPDAAKFSVTFFPDNTVTAFILAAVGCAGTRRWGLAALFMSAAVLCKEVAIAVAAGLLAAAVLSRFFPPEGGTEGGEVRWKRTFLLLSVPFPLFVITQVLGLVVFHARMQGWSNNPISTAYLGGALVGQAFVPFAVTLLLKRRWFAVVPTLSLPAFYIFWSTIAGRGVEGWYQVSMVPLAAVSMATATGEWLSLLPPRWGRWGRWLAAAIAGLAVVLPPPWSVWLAHDRFPWTPSSVDQTGAVAKLIRERRPRHVATVSCFWAYAYYPWRPPNTRVTRWSLPNDTKTDSVLVPTSVLDSNLAILCQTAAAAFKALPRAQRKKCSIFSSSDYEVIREPRNCLPLRGANGATPGQRIVEKHEYRANDLRLDGCVTLGSDLALQGHDCPSKIVAFGPYVDASEDATIQAQFRLKTDVVAQVSLEIASDLGSVVYGGTSQELSADQPTFVGFRVQLPRAARGLEARIAIHAQGLVKFEVNDFSLTVE